MKAVVYEGPGKIAVQDVDTPRIEHPADAIVRLTTTALCGSDLHMYDGRTSMSPGKVLGHEPLGVIEEVGQGVKSLKKGDRVVMPFNVACGYCYNCLRGWTSACLTMNPNAAGAAWGYANMGPWQGGQAEYLRVPLADFNAMKLPGEPGDQWEDDFVLLADIFPTGFHAAELANVGVGSTVAIFGAGPVGLLAAHSCFLRGASEVFVIDSVPSRLALASEMGATPIDYTKGDPGDQVRTLRRNNPGITGSWLPGEEKMDGVMCGIDAIGYQQDALDAPGYNDPKSVLWALANLVNPTGSIGVIGVYRPSDPGAPNEPAKHGVIGEPEGVLWEKGITIGRGQTPVNRYNRQLRDLIVAGKASPSVIVSHRVPLADAAQAYEAFDKRAEGYTKIVFKTGA